MEAARCWLTHGELCHLTGRASEAVLGPVEGLVEKGFLHVFDENRKGLHTAWERQQTRDRHFYRVASFDQCRG